MKKLATLILALGVSVAAFAQNVTLRGIVQDSEGQPVIGAFVVEQGSSNGTMTGLDGDFSLKVRKGAPVEVSCIGYVTQIVQADADKDVVIVMPDDTQMLEETVVIGYGTQKKSVVTASIAKVDSDALGVTAPTRVDNALKGLTAGVTVTSSSGQPGASSRIRIRGVGSINSSDPIYIVDGMPIAGGIDYLNPSDIESIEVLKDAASGAVYGTRAANGVVLVTTKMGSKGKAHIDYNFSFGLSSPWKEREVLNASEYALMINEGLINSGSAPLYADPFSYGEGTNWQKELFNYNAPQQTHELSASGGSDAVSYYLSLGYTDQEGIVGGNFGRSNYNRLTLRSNTNLTLWDSSKDRNFLNKMTLSEQLSYARIRARGIAENSQWGSPLGSALALSPILGVYATDAQIDEYKTIYAGETLVADAAGRIFTIPGGTFNEMVNPIASLSLPANEGWSHKIVGAFGSELQIWDNIKFHSTFSVDMSFWGNSGYTPLFYLATNNKAQTTNVNAQYEKGLVWQIENYLTWNKEFGKHAVSVLLGQSAMENTSDGIWAMRRDLAEDWYSKPYINNAPDNNDEPDKKGAAGWVNSPYRLASYFARADYNYDERYMAQVTFRRDGSSRFGANNKWGNFPSFSLGWNIHKEPYITMPAWFTTAKMRVSWGVNGSDAFEAFRYTTLTSRDNNYIIGEGETTALGVKSSGLANPDLHWERSIQTDLGFDLGFLNNALTLTVDLYNKTTDGMLLQMPTPAYVGESSPWGNTGKMVNRGVEFEGSYKWGAGDWNFHLGGNATYLYNRLISMGNESGFNNYDSFQGAGTMTRGENGYPFPFFYGLKTDGIFQNQAEIDSYTDPKTGNLLMPDAQPGDVRFVDVNGDGIVSDEDRTYIGNGMPDWTFGLNFSVSWKGLDFYMLWQSTVGNDILDVTRRNDISSTNLPSYMLGRWTGEGTSNKIPRFQIGDNDNWQMSDLFVQDGSYLRLKNIQLGYTLPQKWTKVAFISSLRFYVAAENLLTFTNYRGFDPEISSGGTSLGVDYGVYPQPRTLLCGLNLKF